MPREESRVVSYVVGCRYYTGNGATSKNKSVNHSAIITLFILINTTPGNKRLWILMPLWGIGVFILLYFIAALLYPGGSQVDQFSKGFSWLNNYWCDLLHDKAKNDLNNPAKPFAIIAMIILCISLCVFWYIIPYNLGNKKSTRLVVQYTGVASMITAVFSFTSYHDVVINISSALALVAMIITIHALLKKRCSYFLCWGYFVCCSVL